MYTGMNVYKCYLRKKDIFGLTVPLQKQDKGCLKN